MLLNNQVFCPKQHKTKWWQYWLLATRNVMTWCGALTGMLDLGCSQRATHPQKAERKISSLLLHKQGYMCVCVWFSVLWLFLPSTLPSLTFSILWTIPYTLKHVSLPNRVKDSIKEVPPENQTASKDLLSLEREVTLPMKMENSWVEESLFPVLVFH